tara:strand:- start:441 stop:608 length:168 start_codon:yes stop_codon:yes gene_type:complete
MMDRKAKEGGLTEEEIKEFLAKGGKITVCPTGARTQDINFKYGGFYGKKKKDKDD